MINNKNLLNGFAFCLAIFSLTAINAAGPEIDPGKHKQYLQMAKEVYEKDTKSIEIPIPEYMAKPVTNAIKLLFERSGEPATDVHIRITNEPNLNAKTYVGPYFVITKGLLDLLESEAQRRFKVDGNKSRGLDYYRERLVAGVMGHELGHFLAGHGLRLLAEQEKTSKKLSETAAFEQLKKSMINSQQGEYEADRMGLALMEKAGYEADYIYAVLGLLDAEMQKNCEKNEGRDCRANNYTSTHPSGHERLAKFKTSEQSYHEDMAKIERAVSAVELGIDLPSAISVMEAELQKNKHNAYFQRILAIALHKSWLETVKFEDQKLRSILTVPSFYDKLANKPKPGRRGEKAVPGSRVKYLAAVDAYRVSIENPQKSDYVSGFATLLAYDPQNEAAADRLSAIAISNEVTLASANNRAVVLFLNGKIAEAGKILDTLATELDNNLGKLMKAAETDKEILAGLQQRQMQIFTSQSFDKGYLRDEQTLLLNLALFAHATGQKDTSKKIAEYFVRYYDSTSLWSKHLAKLNGLSVEPSAEPQNSVAGVQVGSSLDAVLKKFGKPTKAVPTSDGGTIYYYSSRNIRVVTTALGVRGISVSTGSAELLNNRLAVGATSADVEKALGKSIRSAQGYAIYGTTNKIGVRFENGKAVEYMVQ